jgi:membrane associated rhomboid family serine protease
MLEDRSYMQGSEYRMRPAFPITIVLIVLNLAVFLFMEISKVYGSEQLWSIINNCALHHKGFQFWQLLTFQFMHADRLHFLFNMIMLFLFGKSVEESIGSKHTLLLYLCSGFVGGLLQLGLGFIPKFFPNIVVGASAGVFALLAAFSTLDPNREILLFFVLPIRAKYLLIFAGVVAGFYVVVPAEQGVAHGAHLGGLLAGAAYIRWIIQTPVAFRVPSMFRRTRRSKKSPQRMRYPAAEEDDELPPEEFISKEVDPILEKISAHGMQSLTPRERKILEAARTKMAKR